MSLDRPPDGFADLMQGIGDLLRASHVAVGAVHPDALAFQDSMGEAAPYRRLGPPIILIIDIGGHPLGLGVLAQPWEPQEHIEVRLHRHSPMTGRMLVSPLMRT